MCGSFLLPETSPQVPCRDSRIRHAVADAGQLRTYLDLLASVLQLAATLLDEDAQPAESPGRACRVSSCLAPFWADDGGASSWTFGLVSALILA